MRLQQSILFVCLQGMWNFFFQTQVLICNWGDQRIWVLCKGRPLVVHAHIVQEAVAEYIFSESSCAWPGPVEAALGEFQTF